MSWSDVGSILEQKFERYINMNEQSFGMCMDSLKWLEFDENTLAYQVFSSQMNSLQLPINLFENLMLFEDLRHELSGVEDFPIDIPDQYFRFPAKNDPRVGLGGVRLSILKDEEKCFSKLIPDLAKKEAQDIQRVKSSSREFMRFRKDESITRELVNRLEFLSMFGFFEVYLIDLLSSSIGDGSEDTCLKVRKLSMKLSFDDFLKEVLKELEPELVTLMEKIHSKIFVYLHFCYLARNIHIHNLGRINKKTIKQGSEKKTFIKMSSYYENEEVHKTTLNLNAEGFSTMPINLNNYLNLGLVVSNFRGLIMIISEIIEFYIKQKSELRKNRESVN